MVNKSTTGSGSASAQIDNSAADAAGIVSLADALAALPKTTEQTMKGFLDRQMANEKNLNDSLVEQFGSAIDNSELAASMNDVKESVRTQDAANPPIANDETQPEYLSKIQSDLDRILEIQGDSFRTDVRRDDAVIDDSSMSEDGNKSDDGDDEPPTVLPEQQIEPRVESDDSELRSYQHDGESESGDTADYNQSSSIGLMSELVAAQGEQNSLLADIEDKLTDTADEKVEPLDDVVGDVDSSTGLVSDMESAEREQNSLTSGVEEPIPDVDDGHAESSDAAMPDDNHDDDVVRRMDFTQGVEKINSTLDDILSRFGNSADNDGNVNAVHVDVNENFDKTDSASDTMHGESSVTEMNDSMADAGTEGTGVDTEILNEPKEPASSDELFPPSRDFSNERSDDSFTALANDASGATDAMNIQDEMRTESVEPELVNSDDGGRADQHDYNMDERMGADSVDAPVVDESTPDLDVRMDMEARTERDVTPNLNDVQLFNRMSLTTEEIHVLASEIGKAVAENIVDREGEKARAAAYLDEVERIVKAGT